ncbi:MAG: thioredoxin family protein, partial [Pseudomonadota bacterium]
TVPLALGGLAVAAAVAVLVPPAPVAQAALGGPWQDFARDRISAEVQAGNVVFVDVTADWCLTCKVNKRLVLQEDPVRDLLAKDGTVAMRADWTRPDDAIAAYLQDNARFGIPFNAVYGPGAPEGIPLPELLTDGVVTEALTRAAQN